MNGITIPSSQKYLLSKERKKTEDYQAEIRDYIENRPGAVLRTYDFEKLLGTSSASNHIKKLMKRGYITRKRVKAGKGISYTYKYHAQPVGHDQAVIENGGVLTRKLDLPVFGITNDSMNALRERLLDYVTECDLEDIQGAVKFYKWLNNEKKTIQAKRDKALGAS